MAEVLQFDKKLEASLVRGGFVMTPIARNILRSLDLVASECGGAITLVAAAPGIGKTEALRSCKHARLDAIMFTAVDGEGGSLGASSERAQLLGLSEPKANNLMVDRQRIAEEIGADGLLLVDEAQYLARRNSKGADDWSAFDSLRAMSEEGCFSVAFVGDLSLLELADKRAGLWRRAGQGRRLVLRNVERGDVEALAAQRGVSDAASVEALYKVARREGGLGYVETIARHADRMAGGARIESEHVIAALKYLNLHRVGGK